MTPFLKQNCNIVTATDDINFRTNILRLDENVFVFNLIKYFRFLYSKEELLQNQVNILDTITSKKQT